jgi:EmrB/QacA subfamily drug resistance transporter
MTMQSTDSRRWYALGLLCMAFFMVVLGSTIVYTAVPSIARDLGFSVEGAQWVFTAYALTFGGLLLFGGRTADLLGRRRMFVVGVALFVLSSLLCGLSWDGGVLIGARAVQGAAAAIMSPAALSLVMTTFTQPAERNRALGVWSAVGGTGATAGLLVGGLLVDGPGWRWVFFLNVPVGVAMLAAVPALLAESAERTAERRFDPAGAVTATLGLIALVYAVTAAPTAGWASASTIVLLLVAALLLAVFVAVEARSAAPLLPLRIFRSRTLVGGNLVMLVAGMAVDGMLFTLTLYAQNVLGYSAIAFGLAVAVMTLASIGGSWTAQRTVTRIGFRPVAAAGLVLLGVACALLIGVSPGGDFAHDLFLGLFVFGLGMGGAFVAGSISSLADVDEQDAGVASGLQNASFNIGTALGVALLSTVAVARTDALRHGGTAGAGMLTSGYSWAFAAAVVVCVLGLVAALTLLRGGSPAPAEPAAEAQPAH